MKTLHLSIIAILFLVISITSSVYAQSSSAGSASLAKVSVGLFNMTETSPTIIISGIVYKAFSQNIVLTIFNQQNQLISVSQLQPGLDGTFSQNIIPSDSLWSKGNYTVRMTSGSQNLTESTFYFPGIGCCKRIIIPGIQGHLSNSTNYLSPLKQFKSGVALKDITCAPDLQLIIKAKSHSPACVKPVDVSKLVERGWADKPNSLQEQLDFANVCLGMNDACRHRYDTNKYPFGIAALIIYHPPDLCLNPTPHSIPYGMPSCPPNKFYLKINSNSTAYLMGYNICDGNSCATSNNLSIILPLNTGLNPDYQMIGLPVNLQWKYGDTVGIQLYVSPTNDNKTASLVDLGNSSIVP